MITKKNGTKSLIKSLVENEVRKQMLKEKTELRNNPKEQFYMDDRYISDIMSKEISHSIMDQSFGLNFSLIGKLGKPVIIRISYNDKPIKEFKNLKEAIKFWNDILDKGYIE